MTSAQSLLFVFGLGYSAQQLALRLKPQGWRVAGTVRTEKKAAQLRADGIEAQVWPGEGEIAVPPGAHWLVTVPPGRGGCPAARACGDQAGVAASLTYLSTTGVSGDLNGGWAFEWTALAPGSVRAEARVLAEAQWQAATGETARIVRLPGIYGPGRSPLDRVRDGSAQRVIQIRRLVCVRLAEDCPRQGSRAPVPEREQGRGDRDRRPDPREVERGSGFDVFAPDRR
jgi:nucleoside-diphosphate-sugar epimerase